MPQKIKLNILNNGTYKMVEKDNTKDRWLYRRWVVTGYWQLTDSLVDFRRRAHDSLKWEETYTFTEFNYILFKELSVEGSSYYASIIRLNPNEMELYIPWLDSKLLFRKWHFRF